MDELWLPRIYYYHTEEMEYVGHVEDDMPITAYVEDGRFVRQFTAKTIVSLLLTLTLWYLTTLIMVYKGWPIRDD